MYENSKEKLALSSLLEFLIVAYSWALSERFINNYWLPQLHIN